MISDVLFDAVEAIRDYQEQFPKVYGGQLKELIDGVTSQMDLLRDYIEVPSELRPQT